MNINQNYFAMKKILQFSIILIFAALIMSCTEEGPRGPQGKPGIDGNANVETFLFTDSVKLSWVSTGIILFYDSVFTIPDSIINEGMVLVYIKFYNFDQWWYMSPGVAAAGLLATRFAYTSNQLYIEALNRDGNAWTGGNIEPVHSIRVVLVPSTTATLVHRQNINLTDYEAVRKHLGISREYVFY